MSTQEASQSIESHWEDVLQRLALEQKREVFLEALYVHGHASPVQLQELEQVRVCIEDDFRALDIMGYFNP